MATETITLFDQHDIEIVARQQLQRIIAQVKDADRMNLIIRCGRKLTEKECLTHGERLLLYTLMMMLRFDGIVLLPARLLNHNIGRVQAYEQICMEVYKAIA
jgi:hypothetical protein